MPDISSHTILIADDEPAVGLIATRVLQIKHYHVEVRSSGQEVADLYAAGDAGYALVLLDLSMPPPAGSDLIELIRKTAPDLPIVLMSGFDMVSATDRAPGATDFLQKPFRGPELIELVAKYIGHPAS